MSTAVAAERVADNKKEAKLKRQFVSFRFYQVQPEWRRRSKAQRQADKEQFEQVLLSFTDKKLAQILTYTSMGLKAEADMLLWVITHDLNVIQELASALAKTGLGAYLTSPHSFLAMTKRSMYIDKLDPEHQEDRVHIIPGKYKYFFV